MHARVLPIGIALLFALHADASAQDTAPGAQPPQPNAHPHTNPLPPPSSEPESPEKRFGVGYKIGNGVGFAGADILVGITPHISLDLQANYIPDFDSGFAIAPSVQGNLRPRGNTPYVGLGYVYLDATLGDINATGHGFFANIGYEWKWSSGLGILLGGGVGVLQEVSATDGVTSVTLGGKVSPNLEFGIRYRFF